MQEKELKKRLESIEYISTQLLAAFKLKNESYIKRRLRQLIALNGRLAEKAREDNQTELLPLTEQIGAEISKIQENLDNHHACMGYVGVIVKLVGKEEKEEEYMEMYHAYFSRTSPTKYKLLKGAHIDTEMSKDGFYLAHTPEAALAIVEFLQGIESERLTLMKVRISVKVADEIVVSQQDHFLIPVKNYGKVNKAIDEGLIKFERA